MEDFDIEMHGDKGGTAFTKAGPGCVVASDYDGWNEVNIYRRDAIAIAKHFKLTEEDLK